VGNLELTRALNNGQLKGTTLGKVRTELSHNPFGELQRETSTYNNWGQSKINYSRRQKTMGFVR
jgi:hypothetical protein